MNATQSWQTGIILLAAGQSRRFGADKRKAPMDACGTPLLAGSVDAARRSGFPVLLCLRPGDESLAQALSGPGVTPVICAKAERGMGDTLAAAVQNLPAWQCALVALGDMPCIQPATYQILADGVSRNPAAIARPTFAGAAGHPVAFSSRWYAKLAECRGDRGARALIAAHPDQVLMIPVDDPGIRVDVDLPQDLARLYAAEAGCAGSR